MQNISTKNKLAAIAILSVIFVFASCNGAGPKAPAASATLWSNGSGASFSATKNEVDGNTYFSTSREISVEGGGSVSFEATCVYKADKDERSNDFWLKLSGSPKDKDGMMAALDMVKMETEGSGEAVTGRLVSVRSTGEQGGIMVALPLGSNFVYETNETADYAQGNLDPAKIEIPQKLTIPLADGRSPIISLDAGDKGLQEMLAACKASKPA